MRRRVEGSSSSIRAPPATTVVSIARMFEDFTLFIAPKGLNQPTETSRQRELAIVITNDLRTLPGHDSSVSGIVVCTIFYRQVNESCHS